MNLEPIGDTPSPASANRWRVAPFGDVKLSNLAAGERPIVVSLFGDQTIDLRASAAATINVVSIGAMGDLEIKVRPGTRVIFDGFTLFGDIEDDSSGRVTDDQMVVRVSRWSLFGDIEVEVDDD